MVWRRSTPCSILTAWLRYAPCSLKNQVGTALPHPWLRTTRCSQKNQAGAAKLSRTPSLPTFGKERARIVPEASVLAFARRVPSSWSLRTTSRLPGFGVSADNAVLRKTNETHLETHLVLRKTRLEKVKHPKHLVLRKTHLEKVKHPTRLVLRKAHLSFRRCRRQSSAAGPEASPARETHL